MKLPTAKEIHASIREDNLLGAGGNGTVYSLNDYPDYAVKINRWHQGYQIGGAAEEIGPVTLVPDLYEGRNFGQPVAEYGASVLLLRLQKGDPCAVPTHWKSDPAISQAVCDARYARQVHAAASMPAAAYRQLIDDMLYLNATNRRIDCSKSDNILIDPDSARFNIIDVVQVASDHHHRNAPGDLLIMLVGNSYCHYGAMKESALNVSRNIILHKLLSAAEEKGIAFVAYDSSSYSWSVQLAGYEPGSAESHALEQRLGLKLSKPEVKLPPRPRARPLPNAGWDFV